jgi:nicotinic acid mononucleotide adenylyltransferase
MSGSAAAEQPPNKQVVFTFQGAFGPPTYGHFMSMKNFATKISEDYPDNHVTMLFMPGGYSGDKKHLYPTQSDRKVVLDVFCERLKDDFPLLNFETSEIEYGIVNEIPDSKSKSNPATFVTIDALRVKYPGATILVGMGLDNMFELPFWSNVDSYADKCEKIYVVNRKLSREDELVVKTCNITNTPSGDAGGDAVGDAGGEKKIQIKIKASIPIWWNKLDDAEITNKMAAKLGFKNTFNTKAQFADAMRLAEEFNYNARLPEIVIIQPPVDMPIPGTSSTLLRKLIVSFNVEADADRKNELKQMIQTMMFGPNPELDTTLLTRVVDKTISGYDYESLSKGQSTVLPVDIQNILKQAEDKDFVDYNLLFPGGGGGGAGAGGGYRKKTRKNKKKSTKRRLRKVKMNSRNLRMKKKRTRSRK